ncbi:hypothetical protein PMI16_04852 [Herbaspirillum sp. CF444]|nr:hypothetical protein PMI16_04852 [Herbaspirillum sp. CF444]
MTPAKTVQAPFQAICGVAKPRRATSPAAFCALHLILNWHSHGLVGNHEQLQAA